MYEIFLFINIPKEFASTPNNININENPNINANNFLLTNLFNFFPFVSFASWSSDFIPSPKRYPTNSGTIGNMQG